MSQRSVRVLRLVAREELEERKAARAVVELLGQALDRGQCLATIALYEGEGWLAWGSLFEGVGGRWW